MFFRRARCLLYFTCLGCLCVWRFSGEGPDAFYSFTCLGCLCVWRFSGEGPDAFYSFTCQGCMCVWRFSGERPDAFYCFTCLGCICVWHFSGERQDAFYCFTGLECMCVLCFSGERPGARCLLLLQPPGGHRHLCCAWQRLWPGRGHLPLQVSCLLVVVCPSCQRLWPGGGCFVHGIGFGQVEDALCMALALARWRMLCIPSLALAR